MFSYTATYKHHSAQKCSWTGWCKRECQWIYFWGAHSHLGWRIFFSLYLSVNISTLWTAISNFSVYKDHLESGMCCAVASHLSNSKEQNLQESWGCWQMRWFALPPRTSCCYYYYYYYHYHYYYYYYYYCILAWPLRDQCLNEDFWNVQNCLDSKIILAYSHWKWEWSINFLLGLYFNFSFKKNFKIIRAILLKSQSRQDFTCNTQPN